jgi:hypothetical protein
VIPSDECHPEVMDNRTPQPKHESIPQPGTKRVRIDPFPESDLPATNDQRTLTRRATRERLRTQHELRVRNERLVLSAAASGASFRAIAQQMGYSERHIRNIYKRAMARPGDDDVAEHRAIQTDRLNRLLFATWGDSMENNPLSVRNSLRIIQELNRMQPGAYPRVGIDVSGTIEHRDASIERTAWALEAIKRQRERQASFAIEAAAVDNVDPAPVGNGTLGT